MNRFLSAATATWFGLGLMPKASGTFGSLGALPLVWLLVYAGYGVGALFIAAAMLFFAGVWATHQIISGQKDKDPSKVVIDEVVGQILSFALVWPELDTVAGWKFYLAGFVLFRFFDICKMGPVKFFDRRVHNAWGVMLDDVFAGIIAALCLYAGRGIL